MATPSSSPAPPIIHVYYGPDHEMVDWLDQLPPGAYILTYRDSSTTGARGKGQRVPDGWVLDTGDGDEYIVGAWDLDVDQAVAKAQDYLLRIGYGR